MKYIPPKYNQSSFNCPNCGAFAQQNWIEISPLFTGTSLGDMELCVCEHCNQRSYWYLQKMIIPDIGGVSLPNPDLPADVAEDYIEARSILSRSPKGAAALLRLGIQKLCKHLGQKGENINNDIAELVKQGLPPMVQQSLDILRVVGNSAVHPGTIDLDDNQDLAVALFDLINVIAEVMITQPKHIKSLYSKLPANSIAAINKRDRK
jgi:hypothetical protein